MRLLKNTITFVGNFGLRRFARDLRYRCVNGLYEICLGVKTGGMVKLPDLGIHYPDLIEYAPIGYTAVYSVLRQIPLSPSDVVFLDYGSGKGRAVVAAGTLPYKKVIGLELSERLNNFAKINVERMRFRRAAQIELVQCDAVEFDVPDDVNVIYVFNSFYGETLAAVVNKIVALQEVAPREIYIVFFNKIHFEKLIQARGYQSTRPLGFSHFYPNYSSGIYEI